MGKRRVKQRRITAKLERDKGYGNLDGSKCVSASNEENPSQIISNLDGGLIF